MNDLAGHVSSTDAEQIKADLRLARRLEEELNDEDVEAQILGTTMLSKPRSATVSSVKTSLAEELATVRAKYDSNESSIDLYVQRSQVLKNVFEELKGEKFETCKVSVEFVGEPAADTGGPTRELFSIFFQQAIFSRVTRGTFPNMTFMHDQSALAEGEYKMLGQLVALALLNGACGPHIFVPSLVYFILGAHDDQDTSTLIQQLPLENHEVKKKLEELNSCEDHEKWSEAILNFDERFDMGINSATIAFEEKERVIKDAVKYIMVSSVAEELYSFKEGLSLFNVLPILQKYSEEAFKELTYVQINEQDIRKHLTPSFSVKGSTKRASEELIAYNFNQFLKKVSRGAVTRNVIDLDEVLNSQPFSEKVCTLNLNDVLQFITGCRFVPPGGIEISMLFEHNVLHGARVKANTCGNTFTFPVNKRYNCENSSEFTCHFADDIFDGPAYGSI